MAELDRLVAGIRCRDVLDDLSEFVDGGLDPARLAQLRQHLAGCDACTAFGGHFAALIDVARRELGVCDPVSPDVSERLRERLKTEYGKGKG